MLACARPLVGDPTSKMSTAVVLLSNALDRFTAEVVATTPLTATVREVHLRRVDGALAFEPGQYVVVQLEDTDGALVDRPYSLCRPPAGADFALCVQTRGGGFPSLLTALAPGAQATVAGPRGVLTLPPREDPRDLLLVATGSGIGPFRAMFEQLRARTTTRRIFLLMGARTQADLLYDADWRALAASTPSFDYHPVLSRAADAWSGHRGHVETVVPQLGLDGQRTVALLCGSPGMVMETRALLAGLGWPSSAIRTEY